MKRTVFKENIWKQIGFILLLVVLAALTILLWLPEFTKSKDILFYSLIFVCLSVFIVAIYERVTKGRIIFDTDKVIYGKTVVKANELEEVIHWEKLQYKVFFAGRKKLIITKFLFSKDDQKQIAALLAALLVESYSSLDQDGIEARFDNAEYEFEKTEKHIPNIRGYSIMGWVLCLPCLVAFLFFRFVMGLKTEEIGEVWAIYATAGLFVILGVGLGTLDKFLPKKTFSFKDDIFTVSKNGKILHSFSINQVTGVSVPATRWSSSYGLIFYIAEAKKPLKVHLIGFSAKDRKEILTAIKKILYI